MTKNREHDEIVPESSSGTSLFHHEWVSYDSEKFKVTFSPEALDALQQLVNNIQDSFPTEPKTPEVGENTTPTALVTQEIADAVTDAMIVAGKSDTAIKKFIARVRVLLPWKKKWSDIKAIKQEVWKKVEKYGHSHFAHIVVHYTTWPEMKALNEAPIIVRPEEKLDTMIKSLQTRLGFAHIKI